MRFARTALAIALVVGCARSPSEEPALEPSFGGDGLGTPVTAGDGFASGSRLSAAVQQAEGGAARFGGGWHDTKLDVDCTFAAAADMTVRCLPRRSSAQFADAACATPVYTAAASTCAPAPAPAVFFRETPASCTAGIVVRRVGPMIGAASSVALYTRDGTGACVESAPPPVSLSVHVYAAGDAVDPKTFVAQTSLTREPRGASYAVERMVAEDGATAILSVVDTARGQPCSPMAAVISEPQRLRCVPSSRSEVFSVQGVELSAAANPACSVPAGEADRCIKPSIVSLNDRDTCLVETTTFAEVGAPLSAAFGPSGDPSQRTTTPGCFAVDPAKTKLRYDAVGAPVDGASFPLLATVDDGAERVRVRTLVTPTGERLLAKAFYDAQHDTLCTPRRAADGLLRCLPTTTDFPVLAYTDAACTVPVLSAPSGCSIKDRFMVTATACGNQSVYAVGAPIPVSMAYFRSSLGCTPHPSKMDYFAATEVAASEFSAMRTSSGTVTDAPEDPSIR